MSLAAFKEIWLVDFDEFGDIYLEPKEQKATQKGGWTKGRTLGLKRLAEEQAGTVILRHERC